LMVWNFWRIVAGRWITSAGSGGAVIWGRFEAHKEQTLKEFPAAMASVFFTHRGVGSASAPLVGALVGRDKPWAMANLATGVARPVGWVALSFFDSAWMLVSFFWYLGVRNRWLRSLTASEPRRGGTRAGWVGWRRDRNDLRPTHCWRVPVPPVKSYLEATARFGKLPPRNLRTELLEALWGRPRAGPFLGEAPPCGMVDGRRKRMPGKVTHSCRAGTFQIERTGLRPCRDGSPWRQAGLDRAPLQHGLASTAPGREGTSLSRYWGRHRVKRAWVSC